MPVKKIFVMVDDEPAILEIFNEILNDTDFNTHLFDKPLEALDFIKINYENIFAMATDLKMPLMDGNKLIEETKMISPSIMCFLLSAYIHVNTDNSAYSADRMYKKPIKIGPFKSDLIDIFQSQEN